jgi:hypothetical protein
VRAPESEPGARPARETPRPAARRVQGAVAALHYRVAGGYPVTDVVLAPGGETFTVLGGERDGVLWVAEEEASFRVGERVEVDLEEGPLGWRPLSVTASAGSALWQMGGLSHDGPLPRVHRFLPARAPAVADADIEVVIEGESFGNSGLREPPAAVLFQGLFEHVPATVLSWSDTRIRCLVPKPGLANRPQVLTGALKVWTATGGFSDGLEWEGPRFTVPFQFAGDRYVDGALPIPVHFDPRGFPWPADSVRAVLERSMAAWNEAAGTYFRLALQGETEGPGERRRDGVNAVTWTDPWPHAPSWLAVTWSAFDPATGERFETDVEINATVPWSMTDLPVPGRYDLRTVLTHEFGHWLRLGHVLDTKSVMNAFVTQATPVFRLSQGDRAGAAWIYPTYGAAEASHERWAIGSGEEVVLRVQALDRQGVPRAGLPAAAVEAEVSWRPAAWARNGPDFHPLPWRHPASRDTDAEGRTEIPVSLPESPGTARLRVLAGGQALRDQPVVTIEAGGSSRLGFSLRVPGRAPLSGPALRALVRLPEAAPVGLRVLDVRGRAILASDPGLVPAGETEIAIELVREGVPLAAGVYFLEARAGGDRRVAKFVLVR